MIQHHGAGVEAAAAARSQADRRALAQGLVERYEAGALRGLQKFGRLAEEGNALFLHGKAAKAQKRAGKGALRGFSFVFAQKRFGGGEPPDVPGGRAGKVGAFHPLAGDEKPFARSRRAFTPAGR